MAAKKEKPAQTLEEYIRAGYIKAKDQAEKKYVSAKSKAETYAEVGPNVNDAYLKAKVKADTDYTKALKAYQEMSINTWFGNIVSTITFFKRAFYIGKYVHPDSTISIYRSPCSASEGYVVTEGNHCDFDIFMGNGNRIGTANFLWFSIGPNETVLADILYNGGKTKAVLEKMGLDYQALEKSVMDMERCSHEWPNSTETQLRQVYFPIGEDKYHLLTILPASSLMWKCTGIIRSFRTGAFAARDTKDPAYGSDWEEIRDLTTVGFGGTKPQNISALNSRRGGKAFLIPSLPPLLASQTVRLPKKNFFYDTLRSQSIAPDLFALHKLMKADRNNVEIREKIKEFLMHMVDIALAGGEKVRETPEGWTEKETCANLSAPQKIWLDDKYIERRHDPDWIASVSDDFARWVIKTYERLLGHEAYILGDGEFSFFAKCMEDALKEEVRGE